jgi:hypothetical protein
MIKPKVSSSNTTMVLGFRERNLCRIKGHPMREMERILVVENKDHVASKVERLRGSQPLGSSGKEKP